LNLNQRLNLFRFQYLNQFLSQNQRRNHRHLRKSRQLLKSHRLSKNLPHLLLKKSRLYRQWSLSHLHQSQSLCLS
jgi:hypothetical protein